MATFYSLINARFNERRSDAILHAFVAIIGDILSSHDKNQIHVYNHVRVHTVYLIDCELRVCFRSIFSKRKSKHVNPYTNTLKPTVISSSRERQARVRHIELLPVPSANGSFFLSLDPSMMKPYWLVLTANNISESAGEPALLCNLARVSLLTNSKF